MSTPTADPTGDAATIAHVQAHLTRLLSNSPLYAHLFTTATLASASPGRVVLHLPLEPRHLNSKASLHGSVSAALVDLLGGVAIAAHDARDGTGVSTDMHVSFAGGAKAGDVLEAAGNAERVGGTLAFTTVVLRKVDAAKGPGGGALVARGSHTKYVRVP